MQIPALVEPLAGQGFRARVGSPFDLSVEGPTPEMAVDRLREQVAELVAAGVRFATIEVATEHPLSRFAGRLKNHPLLDDWLEAITEGRRQADKGVVQP